MDTLSAIQARESCRQYSDRPVEREKLLQCLEAARLAPSACNSQPWRFVAVTTPELAVQLAPLTQRLGLNRFADQVGTFVVVCEQPAYLSAKITERQPNQKYAQMDVGIAVAHFCLAATSLGLSTCILGMFSEERVRALLAIPEESTIRLILAVGYAATDTLRAKKRKPLEEIAQIL